MSEETDEYTDQIGWTTSGAETVLSDLKDIEEVVKKEPETLTHHCSMCGSRMQIPGQRERGTESYAHIQNADTKIGLASECSRIIGRLLMGNFTSRIL